MNLIDTMREIRERNGWDAERVVELLLHFIGDSMLADEAVHALREYAVTPPEPSELMLAEIHPEED